VIERYRECDLILLECNYDKQMLASGPYPRALKNRVGGNLGHLCNDQAAELVSQLDLTRLKHLVISHVSEKNNRPELALGSLQAVLTGWQGNLLVADQAQGLSWITL
jgi:phosphoribosyl 1,2-cyclic phosphodiesterase